jgi:hypothetical protein
MAGKKQKGRAAWLVTREWVSDQPRREIVAIFNPWKDRPRSQAGFPETKAND